MGYSKHTIKGLSWMGGFRVFSRVIVFAKTAIIARILTPNQFGVFGIASLVLSLIEILTETGVNVFLVQEKDDIDKYVDASWIMSIGRGIVISVLIIVTAPLVSGFFNSPDSYNLILLISIVPFLRGFINPSEVKFQKNLQFHQEFYFRSILFLVESFVSTMLVLITHETSALIWGMIVSVIAEIILSFMFIKPIPRIRFQKGQLKMVISRGRWVTVAGVFNYLFHNADNMVVGRMLNTGSLGYYQMAYRISMLPITEVAEVFSKVTFPVYVKISEDSERLKKAFLKTTIGVSVLVIPLGFLFFFFPFPIIKLVLGPKWIEIAPVLQILAIFGVVRAISGSASALFLALKRQDIVTIITFASFLILIVTIIPLILKFGIIGAGISVLTASVVVVPIIIYYVLKVFNELK